MRKFDTVCAQGDVLIRRVENMPKERAEIPARDGRVVIAHSETGHDHVMFLDKTADTPSVRMYQGDNPLVAWLEVNRPAALEHMRSHDTHEPIMFEPGIYEVRRQREHTPEGWRQVQD